MLAREDGKGAGEFEKVYCMLDEYFFGCQTNIIKFGCMMDEDDNLLLIEDRIMNGRIMRFCARNSSQAHVRAF